MREVSRDNGNVLYLAVRLGYTVVCICQNSANIQDFCISLCVNFNSKEKKCKKLNSS